MTSAGGQTDSTNSRPGDSRPGGFIAAGTLQLLGSVLLGMGWLFFGVGVAMCGDSGSTSYCGNVTLLWLVTGLAIGLCFVSAIMLLAAAAQARGSRRRLIAGQFSCGSLFFLVMIGAAFWSTASGPIS